MDELITVLQNFGFPVAVAIFLLVSFQKTIQSSTKEVCDLKNVIIELKSIIETQKDHINELAEEIKGLRK